MKQTINLLSGKEIELPTRIYAKKDLDEMGYDYAEKAIFFNKAKPYENFSEVAEVVLKNMAILNYTDCSSIPFSLELLKDSVEKQIASSSDFIILPYFKEETDYDVKTKIEYAERLKRDYGLKKEIILELSYKSSIPAKELFDLSHHFDFLSVFYGVSYGHYSSFEKLVRRAVSFKATTGKKVFCMAVPFKFSGEHMKDCRFMPCFDLVADFWIKNWRRGGSGDTIKVIDNEDLRSKDYAGWLESGHLPNTVLPLINRTVYDLFREDSQDLREEFEKYVFDGVLTEVRTLNPGTLQDYVSNRFYLQYSVLLIVSYREKMISKHFKDNPLFERYNSAERLLLETKIRQYHTLIKVENVLQSWIELVGKEEKVPINQLISVADEF